MPSYTPIPPTTAQDAEREMEEAFESDHNDDTHSMRRESDGNNGGHKRLNSGYNFQRGYEYDRPPPGSPPPPSPTAIPNDFGNSNGVLPSSPVRRSLPRPSFLRTIAGAVLPTHYIRVSTEASASHTVGGGTENDGVFTNVMAKPQRQRVVVTQNGDMRIVPEEMQKDAPPSYMEAQADEVPSYWETTVHAPVGMESGANMIIDHLPTGSFLIFCLNAFISFFFQFIGFVLTYLLHTSHAAKYGSRAGLGLTLIQFGFYSRSTNPVESGDNNIEPGYPVATGSSLPSGFNITASSMSRTAPMPDDRILSVSSKDWLSFFFMALGCFLLLSSFIGFWRVKRWENALRYPSVPPSPDDLERDRAMRRNLEAVFGISVGEDDNESTRGISNSETTAEARLARDLRAAGLL